MNSDVTRVYPSKPDELPPEILQLATAIEELPDQYRQPLGQALDHVMDSTRRRRRILALVQEALSQLRLDMKYLVFDLEATRRERDQYRNQLDDGTP